MNGAAFGPPPTSYRGTPLGLPAGPGGYFDEKRDRVGNPQQQYQQDPSTGQPLSPTAGSDVSCSKYSDGPSQRNNMGYSQQSLGSASGLGSYSVGSGQSSGLEREGDMSNSRSNQSLLSQRSSGASAPRDSVVIEHYTALKRYLTRQLAAGEVLNQRQNKAREKLVRLSKQQFHELSTDVYDELMRRQNSQSTSPPLNTFLTLPLSTCANGS